MAFRNNRFGVFINAVSSIEKRKEKAEETKKHTKRLAEMQRYVGLSEEKLSLLEDVIFNCEDPNTGKKLIEMGCVVYIELLDVVEAIKARLESRGINTLVITGKSTQKARSDVSERFMSSPYNTVVLFSAAGGESVDLNSSPHIILYDTPKGPKNFSQTIGRIARGFGEFSKFYIHEIVIEETLDEYKQVLLSSKREMEKTILNSDTIPLKQDIGSFDAKVLKKVRDNILWKLGKKKRKPKK